MPPTPLSFSTSHHCSRALHGHSRHGAPALRAPTQQLGPWLGWGIGVYEEGLRKASSTIHTCPCSRGLSSTRCSFMSEGTPGPWPQAEARWPGRTLNPSCLLFLRLTEQQPGAAHGCIPTPSVPGPGAKAPRGEVARVSHTQTSEAHSYMLCSVPSHAQGPVWSSALGENSRDPAAACDCPGGDPSSDLLAAV